MVIPVALTKEATERRHVPTDTTGQASFTSTYSPSHDFVSDFFFPYILGLFGKGMAVSMVHSFIILVILFFTPQATLSLSNQGAASCFCSLPVTLLERFLSSNSMKIEW